MNKIQSVIHCIIELYECDPSFLNDEEFVRGALIKATELTGSTLIKCVSKQFYPQGVTGVALIAESHMSIHTWPENRYAAIDIFTCRRESSIEAAYDYLVKQFQATRHEIKILKRGLGLNGEQT